MRIHTGAKWTLAASTVVVGLGAWAAFNDNGSHGCHAMLGPVSQARSGALRAVEAASEADDDARDAATMALQRWQATLERATKVCGLSAS